MRHRVGTRPLTAVLCDGLACDGYIYKYLWDDLGAYLSVAHWNYRGHGRSALPQDPERVGVLDHAADLDAVREHIGDPPVVLVGHSLGTQIALEAYHARPANVRAMVFLCGTVGHVTSTFRGNDSLARLLPKLLRWSNEHPLLARGLWGNVPPHLGVWLAKVTGDVDARAISSDDFEPYFTHAFNLDFHLFLRMLAAAGEHTAQPLLPAVGVPVLVVAGTHDSFTPPALAEAMASDLPDAQLCMVPGGTHVTPLEHRDLVGLTIEKFLLDRGLLDWPQGIGRAPILS